MFKILQPGTNQTEAGAAGTLPQAISDKEMLRIAHEGHVDEAMKHM